MSSTSSSWRQPSPVGGSLVRADADAPRRPGRTRPGSGGPTTAGGRCTSRACCRPRRSTAWPAPAARSRTRPSRTASPAALASGPVLTNHCSDSRGSTVVLAPRAVPDRVHVRPLLRDDAALLAQRGDDRRPGLVPVQALERAVHGDDAALVHDREARQAVPLADLEVVRVVRRRHLDRAGAERRVDVLVGDDRDAPAGQRQLDLGADQVPVALVVGVHRDRGVAEHRLGPGGGDHDRVVAVAVPDRDQLAVVVGVLDLDVATARSGSAGTS